MITDNHILEAAEWAMGSSSVVTRPKSFLYVNTSGEGGSLRVVYLHGIEKLKSIPTSMPERLRGKGDPLPPGLVEWADECEAGQYWKVDDLLVVRLS